MRINKVNIPKSVELKDGLEDIKMDRLGKIVLIAGKNGSGKTRILSKIFNTLRNRPKNATIESYKAKLLQHQNNLPIHKKALLTYENKLLNLTIQEEINKVNLYINSQKRNISLIEKEILSLEEKINWNKVETSELAESYAAINFVPKSLDLIDCNTYPKDQLINNASNINAVGVNNLPRGAFAKIQVIQDRWFSATHQHSQILDEDKTIAIQEYEKLRQLIEIFLNTSLGRTINDEATIFDFPLGKSNLSDGQKILLQFCMAIYSQETDLKDLILILDEPENHLHPSVIIETIERIQNCVSNGQIWIATHSIPLLAHFEPSLIWYVESNKISHAGKIPEKVLSSLLGNENEVSRLQDFLSLPSQYATSRYAFESLFEPNAVLTDTNDPQSFQIRTDLLKISKNKSKLRILDYGVGKGRLISNIVDLDCDNQEKLIENLDYVAYDKYTYDKVDCENSITKAYGSSNNRYFNDFTSLLSCYDKESFDVVIMCNVLHEIDPKDWLKLFQKEGIITNLLSKNGILLLVEDHQIPIGEKAYQKGFLVLDTPQLKDLFKINEKEKRFKFSDKKGDGRLKAHQIPKNCLINITETSRLSAIKSLSKVAKEKILEIREQEKNYQNGKLHGFWTQQFANSMLNIAEFTTK